MQYLVICHGERLCEWLSHRFKIYETRSNKLAPARTFEKGIFDLAGETGGRANVPLPVGSEGKALEESYCMLLYKSVTKV